MNVHSTKPSIAIANLNQLAMLEGPAEVCLPDLVEILRSFVRFDGLKMSWTDAQDKVRAIWHVSPDMGAGSSSSILFQERFYNNLETKAVVATSALLRNPKKIDNCARYGAGFFDTELYATILQPLGFRHALRLVLHSHGHPLGFLTLTRGDDERPFSLEDERRLHQVQDILSQAMAKRVGPEDHDLVASGDTAMLLCDPSGAIRNLTNNAQQFLNYIFAPDCLLADLGRSVLPQARQWLLPIVARADRPLSRTNGKVAALYRQTRWGGFSARAYRMNASEPGGTSLVSVNLTRYVPLAVRLMRLEAVRTLPKREKEVCLLLAHGCSAPDIAVRLTMSVHTVIGHVASLYDRFEVSSRDQLVVSLLLAE